MGSVCIQAPTTGTSWLLGGMASPQQTNWTLSTTLKTTVDNQTVIKHLILAYSPAFARIPATRVLRRSAPSIHGTATIAHTSRTPHPHMFTTCRGRARFDADPVSTQTAPFLLIGYPTMYFRLAGNYFLNHSSHSRHGSRYSGNTQIPHGHGLSFWEHLLLGCVT